MKIQAAIGCEIPAVNKKLGHYWTLNNKTGKMDEMSKSSIIVGVRQKFNRVYLVRTEKNVYLYFNQGFASVNELDEVNVTIGTVDHAPKENRNIEITSLTGIPSDPIKKISLKVCQCGKVENNEEVYILCDENQIYFVIVAQK